MSLEMLQLVDEDLTWSPSGLPDPWTTNSIPSPSGPGRLDTQVRGAAFHNLAQPEEGPERLIPVAPLVGVAAW
jgi:hypothetical protein